MANKDTPNLCRFLADGAFEPLLLLDQDLRIVAANAAARAIFATIDEGDLVTDHVDDADLIEMLRCASRGQSCPPEVQFTLEQDVYRARVGHTMHKNAPYLTLAMQDVTQLLRLNRARREMVANISHELRAPISTIRLLHDTLNLPSTGKKLRLSIMRKIGRQLDTLQRIVDDMHDLSMIESGQAIMRLVATPLAPLIHEALEHLDEQIQQRKLGVRVKTADDLFVLVDAPQITRVLVNLLDNAIKFTPKKGKIAIKACPNPDSDDTVLVCICDSGPGVPEEERERIFERFYQLDQARKIGRGSGLGLSITKHIIETHNGQVWVESSNLGGACVCFTLLIDSPTAAGPEFED